MKINLDSQTLSIYFKDTDTYPFRIFLFELKTILPDGRSYFVNYKNYPKSDFIIEIKYDDITDYNDSGSVPSYATILADIIAAVSGQAESPKTTRVSSTALAASNIALDEGGKLFWLNAYNDKGSAQYIQVHDSDTLPANGSVPVLTFTLASKATEVIEFGDTPMVFANGIVLVNSSTAATLTIGSGDCWFSALVE